MQKRKLFLDLDGVLADFDRGVKAVTGKRPEEIPMKVMWRELSRHPDFFGTLDFMHDAQDLWRFCEPYGPTILTGLPLGSWAPEQKRRWVAHMLGPHVRVITCMARDKHRHGGPGTVLVDDREKARDPWTQAGGDFILHTSAKESIAALKRLGFTG
ncbi:hypothetical protein FHW79_002853 [Azospirillum sp. OGB3]|uniref:hypothetical protein n=1 Tax=Azospirillum sp. OGB3 TaxID=2587012 RepID=UPI001606D313|nr:hypothetical protein [Azospirillum sp. OGB3]MBB3265233.1 hypothetical protein [Azospirillum sp. OGB3]